MSEVTLCYGLCLTAHVSRVMAYGVGSGFCVGALEHRPLAPPQNLCYRGTLIIRNNAPIGPYSRNMTRALWRP